MSDHPQSPQEVLGQVRARIQEEIDRFGKQLQAIEHNIQELRAQFERSITVVNAQLVELENTWRSAGAASTSGSVAEKPAIDVPRPVEKAGEAIFSQLSDAEQKLHRDAMRYARLLVSEIELYNRDEVEQGRSHKDLYRRLKSHIDRSRQAYESRFGPAVIKKRNYFHEEIVRTLARSDATLLGPDYPLPAK